MEHARPDEAADFVRVFFEIEDSDIGGNESLWARFERGDEVRIANIPMFVFDISLGDLIKVDAVDGVLRSQGVVERGGHSTYRVASTDSAELAGMPLFGELVEMGCNCEMWTPRYAALDVPPTVSGADVSERLERGLQQGLWLFDEAHNGQS